MASGATRRLVPTGRRRLAGRGAVWLAREGKGGADRPDDRSFAAGLDVVCTLALRRTRVERWEARLGSRAGGGRARPTRAAAWLQPPSAGLGLAGERSC